MADPVKAPPAVGFIWTGTYPSWDAACDAAAVVGGQGFDSERWLRRITQQLEDYRNEIRQYGIAPPPRPCSLPGVCALTRPRAIVDFGGSSGWCWEYLRNSLPACSMESYAVVETAQVVAYARKVAMHGAPVTYATLQDPIAGCDLLYCNSVLQYFASNAPLLDLIERTTPAFVLLEDVVAMNDDDFFSTQSYWGAAIPYRFLGLGKLLRELAQAGYDELARYPYASPILGVTKPFDMGNFPEPQRLRYSSSILLQKAGSP